MSEQTQHQAALAEAMAPWFDAWAPAELGKHTKVVTTQELHDMVYRFHPMEFAVDDLVQLLRRRGFSHALIAGEFRWLLRPAA